jgi:4-amino-4-deoxy-L-arabinose transferase-like glycosyltransferase
MKTLLSSRAWWILLLAVLVRVLYFVQYLDSPLPKHLGVDHTYYLEWAREIAQGNWMGTAVFEQAPLYAYGLGAFFSVFGERTNLVLMLQLLIGAGGCILVYACGRRLFDTATATLAGVIAAVYGPFVFYEAAPMKSFLSPALSLVILYAGLRYSERKRVAWLWLAGGAIGLACLIRENHILLLLPLGLWVWTCDQRPTLPAHRRLIHLAAAVLCIALCLAPTTARNWYVGGELVAVTAAGGEALYLAQGPWSNGYYVAPDFIISKPGVEHEDFRREAEHRTGKSLSRTEASRYWFGEALDHVVADPVRTALLTLDKALILLNDFEVPDNADYRVAQRFVPVLGHLPTFGWIGALGLLGMILCVRDWRRYQLALGIVAAHAVSILILYNFGRFRLGMLPVWILFAAYAAIWLLSTTRRAMIESTRRSRWLAGVGLSGTLLLTALIHHARQPLNFDTHTASLTGTLAYQLGDFELAEQSLRNALALRAREHEDAPATATRRYNVARDYQALALVLLQTGRTLEAIDALREARQSPNRADARRSFLIFELRALNAVLAGDPSPAARAAVTAEIEIVAKELRTLGICAQSP